MHPLRTLALSAAALFLAGGALTGPSTAAEPDASSGPTVRAGDAGAARVLDHEDAPTVQELLDKCDTGSLDLCEFHPSGGEEITRGEYKVAGSGENCSSSDTTREINWSSTEGETNSLGVTLSAKAGLKEVYEVSIETTYGHEWTWSKTQQDKVTATLKPGQSVNVMVAADRSKVRGTYEMHFGDRFHGHYIWYVENVEVSAPTFNTPWHTRVDDAPSTC